MATMVENQNFKMRFLFVREMIKIWPQMSFIGLTYKLRWTEIKVKTSYELKIKPHMESVLFAEECLFLGRDSGTHWNHSDFNI